MIRTRKPRGHLWSCPSALQQSEHYRDICLDDCVADANDALLSHSEGSARKRRRIEKLTERVLDGAHLSLKSVRPNQPLRATTSYAHMHAGSGAGATTASETLSGSTLSWEDVCDDWEVLDTFRSTGEISRQKTGPSIIRTLERGRPAKNSVSTSIPDGNRVKPRAQGTKSVPGLSNYALQKAAALRERALKRSLVPGSSTQLPAIQESYQPPPAFDSDPSDDSFAELDLEQGGSPTPAWTSSKWLGTETFKPARVPISNFDGDCSKDELAPTSSKSFTPHSQEPRISHNLGNNRHSGQVTQCEPNASESFKSSALAYRLTRNSEHLDNRPATGTQSKQSNDSFQAFARALPDRGTKPRATASTQHHLHDGEQQLESGSIHSRNSTNVDNLSLPESRRSFGHGSGNSLSTQGNRQIPSIALHDESEMPDRKFSSFVYRNRTPRNAREDRESNDVDLPNILAQLASSSNPSSLSSLDQALFKQGDMPGGSPNNRNQRQQPSSTSSKVAPPQAHLEASPGTVASLQKLQGAQNFSPQDNNGCRPCNNNEHRMPSATLDTCSLSARAPSTQTLLNEWGGWSTLRKSRGPAVIENSSGAKSPTHGRGSAAIVHGKPNSKPLDGSYDMQTNLRDPESSVFGELDAPNRTYDTSTVGSGAANDGQDHASIHTHPSLTSGTSSDTVESLFVTNTSRGHFTDMNRAALSGPLRQKSQHSSQNTHRRSGRSSFRRDQGYGSDSESGTSVGQMLELATEFLDQSDLQGILD